MSNQDTFEESKKRSDLAWAGLEKNPKKYRVMTGDRPTGPLHIGHYFGTLKNRVHLQNKGLETWVLVADYQVLTDRDSAEQIQTHVHEMLLDYLAVGLDPFEANTTIFAHSYVPEL
ncbi:MAG: tryptophan--tRNA ligase, partial [Deltaproteobacteria bacterium]|nr:tryptophan--tRNA ligase [Deltaproteobacteria bacterium]